eukprot:1281945-Rhodomonas_salina.1
MASLDQSPTAATARTTTLTCILRPGARIAAAIKTLATTLDCVLRSVARLPHAHKTLTCIMRPVARHPRTVQRHHGDWRPRGHARLIEFILHSD